MPANLSLPSGAIRAAFATRTRSALCVMVCATALAAQPVGAQTLDAAQARSFQDQIVALQAQINALNQALARAQSASGAPVNAASAPPVEPAHALLERDRAHPSTFVTHGGSFTIYGLFDVALDGATKDMAHLQPVGGAGPVGNLGWLADVSTNMSYIGIRGAQAIGHKGWQFIYQLETQIDISASSGVGETNSSQSNVVKGGLTSRNSYLGLAAPGFGRFMVGKTDAPYKQATARMNPFIGMFGDYAVIMGNTGGDNRVEFGTRLDHAVWYESPDLGGLRVNLLFAPGQNRASNSDNIGAGESDCAGGNVPGSGGSLPIACNDGAFSDAFSGSVSYTRGPVYLVAAYERHGKVNRSSDLTGEYANPPQDYVSADTADEDAAKVGVQLTLPTRTTLSGIYERLHRYVPASLAFQNERQRSGFWFAATQALGKHDLLAAGWAHAGRTPGDPGQHNTSLVLPPLGSTGDAVGGAGVDNIANLATFAWKHDLGGGLSAYVNWARVFNHPYAHFALGAGGRAVTIDCHDASDASGGLASNPHCWAGTQPQGLSTGLHYVF